MERSFAQRTRSGREAGLFPPTESTVDRAELILERRVGFLGKIGIKLARRAGRLLNSVCER
jgi:hypothetical protein